MFFIPGTTTTAVVVVAFNAVRGEATNRECQTLLLTISIVAKQARPA